LQTGERQAFVPLPSSDDLSQFGKQQAIRWDLFYDFRRMSVDNDLTQRIIISNRRVDVGHDILKKAKHRGDALGVDAVLGFLQANDSAGLRILQ
jgi:hypothetical protein